MVQHFLQVSSAFSDDLQQLILSDVHAVLVDDLVDDLGFLFSCTVYFSADECIQQTPGLHRGDDIEQLFSFEYQNAFFFYLGISLHKFIHIHELNYFLNLSHSVLNLWP